MEMKFLETLSSSALKFVVEQLDKKYGSLLTADQVVRSTIQSVNAISIGIIVVLISIIHNPEWEDMSIYYFIALLALLLYNAILFLVSNFSRPDPYNFSLVELVKINDAGEVIAENNEENIKQLYINHAHFLDSKSQSLRKTIKVLKLSFILTTIFFGLFIVIFYYAVYLR